jgi:hypothetical protein
MKMILCKKHVTIIMGALLSLFFVNGATGELNFPVQIPTGTITVDGLPDDWVGIEPILVDPQGDSTCGSGTDIKSVFIAQDNDYLYWRIDTYSDTFLFTEEWMGPTIQISQTGDFIPGDIEASINDNSWGMNGWIMAADMPNPMITLFSGPEYGWADIVAEGKIPLSVFAGANFPRLIGRYSKNGPDTCDSWFLEPGGDGGDGGGG